MGVFAHITNFKMDVNDSRLLKIYQSQKEKLWRKYCNFSKSQAYQVAQYAFQSSMYDRFSISQRIAVFDQVTPQALQDFIHRVFEVTKVQSLIHGNVSTKTAVEVNGLLLRYLKSETLTKMPLGRIVKLPEPGVHCVVYEEEQIDPEAVNS